MKILQPSNFTEVIDFPAFSVFLMCLALIYTSFYMKNVHRHNFFSHVQTLSQCDATGSLITASPLFEPDLILIYVFVRNYVSSKMLCTKWCRSMKTLYLAGRSG
jgi:hypothetical protein